MSFIGDYPEDFTTVSVYFTTHDGNGAPVAPLTAFEAGDVSIYKNGSATQKTSTNGMTMTSPFDGIVGLHQLLIDTSNDTGDSGFWTTGGGGVYTCILNPDTETVNGQVALKVLATFGICLSPALRPTVANRTLDVTATGGAGIDLANVENQGSTLALSGTTIKTATDVETDTQDIQSRLPAALVSGRMDSSTGAMAAAVLTAAAIATDAITAAKIAADAIGASELAADAVTEIQSGLSTLTAAGVRTAVGLGSANLDTQLAAIASYIDTEVMAIKDKTDLIPGTIDGKTFAQLVTLIAAAVLGKCSGLDGTTAIFRAVDDSKDRITATVDANGNRTAITLDAA